MSNDLETENFAVVVVGSLHYDIMIQAPDRPRKGETVIGQHWFPKFGGKGGNQAIAAANSGVSARFVGAVGTDDFSEFMLEKLDKAGVTTERITRTSSKGTGISVAIMDAEGDYGAVIISGANSLIDHDEFEAEALWRNAQVLILQNEIPVGSNIAAAQAAKNTGLQVCLNAAPSRELSKDLLELIDILVVNAIEAEDLCGLKVSGLDSALQAANELTKMVDTIIVTAGGDGVAVASIDEQFVIAALQVELVSTHGAGDMFVGTLCAEIARGNKMRNSVEIANKAAAEHVSKK